MNRILSITHARGEQDVFEMARNGFILSLSQLYTRSTIMDANKTE